MMQFSRRKFMQSSLTLAVAEVAERMNDGHWLLAKSDQVNVAIIGLGWRGQEHLKMYSAIPCARIVGLCDSDTEHLKTAGDIVRSSQRTLPLLTRSLERLLHEPSIDVISVAAPIVDVARLIRGAHQAGKALLFEGANIPSGWPEIHKAMQAASRSASLVQVGACELLDFLLPAPLIPSVLKARLGSPVIVSVTDNNIANSSVWPVMASLTALELVLKATTSNIDFLATAQKPPVITRANGHRSFKLQDSLVNVRMLGGPLAHNPVVLFEGPRGRSRFTIPTAAAEVSALTPLLTFLQNGRQPSLLGNESAQRSFLAKGLASALKNL